MDPYYEENGDLANLISAPPPAPLGKAARPAISPPGGSDSEDAALDHLDKKAAARRKELKEKERKRAEKEARKAAKEAEKAEKKRAKAAKKAAAKTPVKKARPVPPPLPVGVVAPPPPPPRPEVSTYETSVFESVFDGDEPSVFGDQEGAPATDLAQEDWCKEDVDNFVCTLFQGAQFVKYGAHGKGKVKFCIANQEGSFFWSDRNGKTMSSIKLVDVKCVTKGKQTRVLKRSVCADVPDSQCFSIKTGKRTVDLEAPSAAVRDLWVSALRYAAGNVQTHGKIMLHPVTTTEMERQQRELGSRIAELEAERERQDRLLAEKERAIERARQELEDQRARADDELTAKEREIREKEETERQLVAEKARLAAEVERIAHERKRSSAMKNNTLQQLQEEVLALQAVKADAEERAAREKEQMTQLINDSQKLLAKAKGTIHKRQVSRVEHLTRIQQLERDLAEQERRNRELREVVATSSGEDSAHARKLSQVEDALAAAAKEESIVLDEVAEEEEEEEHEQEEQGDVVGVAAAGVPRRERPAHRSTISFAEVLTPAVWQPDGARVDCSQCPKKFTFFRRRHHCRKCGLLVCGSCSSRKAKIEETCDKVRVCESCIATHGYTPQ